MEHPSPAVNNFIRFRWQRPKFCKPAQGIAPGEAIELLAKLRGMNQDLILVALTRSHDHGLRLQAAKVPVDESGVESANLCVAIQRLLGLVRLTPVPH